MTARIDNFAGDGRAYAGYLLELLTLSLPECIDQLEKEVLDVRRDSSPPRTRIVLELGHSTTSAGLRSEVSNTTKQSSPSASQAAPWVKLTASFFDNLPTTEDEWREKRKSAALSTEADILSTAQALATARLETSDPFIDHTEEKDLQDYLRRFAENVGNVLVKAKSRSNISHFLSLIFVATCCVAHHQGYQVDDAQRKLAEVSSGKLSSEGGKGSQALINDRAAVKWLLRQQQCQYRRGLEHRAFETFLLSGKALSFYHLCPKTTEQSELFTEKIPRCEVPDEIHASLPFWIPYFVKLHVGKRWSYSVICSALELDLLDQESEFQRFKAVFQSGKLHACRLGDTKKRNGEGKQVVFMQYNPAAKAQDRPRAPRSKRRKTGQHTTYTAGRGNHEQHHLPRIHHAVVLGTTVLPPHSNPAVLVDSEPARTDQAPSPRTTSFQPINRRDGPTMSDAASGSCQSNSRVSVAPEGPSLNLVSDLAGRGDAESPSAPMVPTLGPPERTSSRGSRPDESGVRDVPTSFDGQGRPWDESARRANGSSPHHVNGVVGWETGSVEQGSGNGDADTSSRLTLPGTGAPSDSEPGARGGKEDPPCHEQDAATGTTWGDITTLAMRGHSPVRTVITGPPGYDEGGTQQNPSPQPPVPRGDISAATAPVPLNSPDVAVDPESSTGSDQADAPSSPSANSNPQHRDGPTTSSNPTRQPRTGTDAEGALGQRNPGGVSAALGGSPLPPINGVARCEHAEWPSTVVVPTLGHTERPDLTLGWGVGSLEQFSINGSSHASGLGTLPDGSCESGRAGTAPIDLSPRVAGFSEAGLMNDPALPLLNTEFGHQPTRGDQHGGIGAGWDDAGNDQLTYTSLDQVVFDFDWVEYLAQWAPQ